MSLKLVSEDSRRRLFEFGDGTWKIAKYIEVTEDCMLGDHYHLNKEECFLLVEGEMEVTLDGVSTKVVAPIVVVVKKGVRHKFMIKKGAKLIGLCSEKFDKSDDHVS